MIILIVILMEIVVSYESENSFRDSDHRKHTRISLLPVFVDGAVGEGAEGAVGE